MRGSDVKTLQRYLTQAGFSTPAIGTFGPITFGNVRAFEKQHKLRVDGVVTRVVAAELRAVATGALGAAAVPAGTAAPAAGATLATPSATTSAASPTLSGTGGATVGDTGAGNPYASPVGKGTLNADGTANPPANAPVAIQQIFAAANQIASNPYTYGGGHNADFSGPGYDCSGSVSYALHGAGMLTAPLDSTEFETWGDAGIGTWITLYSNSGHVFMVIAGLRFDTAAQGSTGGSRWTDAPRSSAGYVVTHPVAW